MNRKQRIFLAGYLLWLPTHIYIWLLSSKFSMEVNKHIWPHSIYKGYYATSHGEKEYHYWNIPPYEISDFLFYAIAPVILYFVIVLLFPGKKKEF